MRAKYIEGYEGLYMITDNGEVWSCLNKLFCKKLKPSIHKLGYRKVILYKNKTKRTFLIHRIVASEFIENLNNKNQVNHIDGNKTNNHFSNLEWVTALENTRHAINLGIFCKYYNKNGKITKKFLTIKNVINIRKMIKNGLKQKIIAKKYNINQATVSKIKNKKRWDHVL